MNNVGVVRAVGFVVAVVGIGLTGLWINETFEALSNGEVLLGMGAVGALIGSLFLWILGP